MKYFFPVIFAAGLLFSFSQVLSAETFHGTVTGLSPDNRSLTLSVSGKGKEKKEIPVWMLTETKFSGLSSLAEISKGDEVTVKAQHNPSSGHWEADSLKLSKVVIHDPGREVPVPKQISREEKKREQVEKEKQNLVDSTAPAS